MTDLLELANEAAYGKGEDLGAKPNVEERLCEAWFKPLSLGQNSPTIRELTVATTAANVGAEEITCTLDVEDTIEKGDVLKFANGLVVVRETTVVGTADTQLPVYALGITLAIGDKAATYCMIRLRSHKEGGMFEFSGSSVEGFNKGNGLFPSQSVIKKGFTFSATGEYLRTDRGAAILERDYINTTKQMWVQTRHAPIIELTQADGTTTRNGTGFGTYEARFGVESVNPTGGGREGLVGFSAQLNGDGIPKQYSLLAVPT